MMKKLAIAAAVFAIAANAQAASNSIDATVTVIKPVAVASTTGLGFGVLARATTGQGDASWTLTPAGVLSADAGNDASAEDHAAADHTAGVFTVTGEPSYNVSLAVTATNGSLAGVTLSAATMDGDATTNDLGAGGSLAVNVGATITLTDTAASVAGGTAGTIALVANY